MQDSHRQLVIILIGLFTLFQLIILFIFGYTPYPDSNGYILLAQESVAHGEPYPIASKLNEYPFLWNIGAINAVAVSLALFHSVSPLLEVDSHHYKLENTVPVIFFTDISCVPKTMPNT